MPGSCRGEVELAAEDTLRLLAEKGGSASLDEVVSDVGDAEAVERAVETLVANGLLRREGGRLTLTEKGWRRAEELLSLHRAAEKLASRLRLVPPHLLAHSVEHFPESLRVLEALHASRPVRLLDLPPGGSGYVVAVADPRPRLLARLVGVGIVPGRRVRVVARLPSALVVEVGVSGRVVALDRDVAGRVLVVPVEAASRGGGEGSAGWAAERGKE